MGTFLKLAVAAAILVAAAQVFFSFVDKTIVENPHVRSDWQTSVPLEKADYRAAAGTADREWLPEPVRRWTAAVREWASSLRRETRSAKIPAS